MRTPRKMHHVDRADRPAGVTPPWPATRATCGQTRQAGYRYLVTDRLLDVTCIRCIDAIHARDRANAAGPFRVDVSADDSGVWCCNALEFKTREEANAYGLDLYRRWTAVHGWRVVPTSTPRP
jgi:hypothetical protein